MNLGYPPLLPISVLSFPPQSGDARIAGEVGAAEADELAGKLAVRLHARGRKPDAPGLAVDRLRLGEGATGEHGDVGAFLGIAHRLVADRMKLCLPRRVGQRLACLVVEEGGP